MRFLIFLILFLLVFLASASKIFLFTGDQLLTLDKFSLAKALYWGAKATNPFDKNVASRLFILKSVVEERRTESEETTFENKPLAQNFDFNVLGESVTVPVLLYHYVRINPDKNDKVGFGLSVTPYDFASQMDYLANQGYHTITPDDLALALFANKSLPTKPIILTFDDSYRDYYTKAFPILKTHQFKAINFVITGFVGGPNYLTWPQIEEMKASGISVFGAHTVHHLALAYLSAASVKREIADSKKDLEDHLGQTVNWLAYPYGSVNDQVAQITKETGYIGAFGTNFGSFQSKDKIFTLPRIKIGGGNSVASFASLLPN